MDLKDMGTNTVEPPAPDAVTVTRDAYELVRQYLADANWTIEEHPVIGALQPDLLVISPEGKPFLVEFKLGAEGSAHFGALAQLVRFQDEYSRVHPGEDAGTVLVTNLRVDQPVESAASQLGVRIVPTGKSDQELGTNLMRKLGG
jgi:hypothetical protein